MGGDAEPIMGGSSFGGGSFGGGGGGGSFMQNGRW